MFLLDLTLNQLETFMGSQIQQIVGANIWMLGVLYMIFILFILIKLQVGMEAGVILGFFAIFIITKGFGGSGGLVGDVVFYGAALIVAFIIFLWMKRDVVG